MRNVYYFLVGLLLLMAMKCLLRIVSGFALVAIFLLLCCEEHHKPIHLDKRDALSLECVFLHYMGSYSFKGKTLQDEYSPEGLCRASMHDLYVEEELESWPEKSHRERSWLTIPEAIACCRHAWMREAVEEGFSKWYADGMVRTLPEKNTS